jgi:hypothetical protein
MACRIRWFFRTVEKQVELFSKEGADEFVDTVGTDFISTNLTARDDSRLAYFYTLMKTVAE